MIFEPDLKLVHRTFDPTFVVSVVNHPEVRPWLGLGTEDLTDGVGEMVSSPLNHTLVSQYAAVIFQWIEPGRYEVHSQCLPAGRGFHSAHVAQEVMRYIFTRTDCFEVITRVPDGNAAALGITRHVGFASTFRREDAWQDPDGERVGVQFFSLPLERWRNRDPMLGEIGHEFHDWLEALKKDAGSPLPAHPEDGDHDRAVGMAALMAQAGQGPKAVLAYNRWASLAGYQQIGLVSETPLVLDLRDAVVQVMGRSAQVLLVR